MGLFSSLFNKKSALDGRGDLFQFYDDKFETYYYVKQSFKLPDMPNATCFIGLVKQKRRPGIDYLRNKYTVDFRIKGVRLDSSEIVMDDGTVVPTIFSERGFVPAISGMETDQIFYAALRGHFATFGLPDKQTECDVGVHFEQLGVERHRIYSVLPAYVQSSPESNEKDFFIKLSRLTFASMSLSLTASLV